MELPDSSTDCSWERDGKFWAGLNSGGVWSLDSVISKHIVHLRFYDSSFCLTRVQRGEKQNINGILSTRPIVCSDG